MELREALAQISEIRQQMARTEVFRGYRAATVAFSGLVAVATAGVQSLLVPSPTHDLRNYLLLWVGAALLSILVFGIDQYLRYHRSVSPWQRDITAMAVEQFLPCLVAGATMTYVLVKFARDQSRMLPGLWSIIFSLGVFASRRLLPFAVFYIAAFYLLAGLYMLARGQGDDALSPWFMGVTFGVGQFLSATILYWCLERDQHVQEQA
jgi:hypothetical protein